jgi:hypothetical protein
MLLRSWAVGTAEYRVKGNEIVCRQLADDAPDARLRQNSDLVHSGDRQHVETSSLPIRQC